jgi:hypothetical protein
MRNRLVILLLLMGQAGIAQGTWYGEIAFSVGSGYNSIFRFKELTGAPSFTGEGMLSAGVNLRRLSGNHFSLETGALYSHQYYFTSPAPGIPGEDKHDSFGMVTIPLAARVDFLKWFFTDAGITLSFQTGSSYADNMSGLGVIAGAGFQYNFRSDLFLRVKAFISQYALLHFMPEDHPQTLLNSGLSVGFGYRFIHLGRCNCPHDNAIPRRKFF